MRIQTTQIKRLNFQISLLEKAFQIEAVDLWMGFFRHSYQNRLSVFDIL